MTSTFATTRLRWSLGLSDQATASYEDEMVAARNCSNDLVPLHPTISVLAVSETLAFALAMTPPQPAFMRRHFVASVLALLGVLLVAFLVLFDWNWLRPSLDRYISNKTEREFHSSDLHVKLGLTPTIQMRDIYFGNAKWSKEAPAMAKIEKLEFSIALRDLPDKILVPRVALTRPELVFERLPDNRKNWILSDPSDTSPSKLRISTLSVDHGHLRYIDHGVPFL